MPKKGQYKCGGELRVDGAADPGAQRPLDSPLDDGVARHDDRVGDGGHGGQVRRERQAFRLRAVEECDFCEDAV